mgnify:CR=1 FL=1|jgi:hypothetical protein
MQRWIKVDEACGELKKRGYKITARTLRDYVRDDRIRHTKPSKFILFKEEWLDEFLEGKYHPETEKLDS